MTGVQTCALPISSPAVTINVKPLPSPRPLNFSGLVGQFDISSDINEVSVKTGDPITFKIMVKGQGNLTLLEPFSLNLPSDIETYDPKRKSNLSKTGNGMGGTTSFEYLLIPQVKGGYTIPAVELNYFDPVQKKYVSKSTEPNQINVSQGDRKSVV